MNQPDKNNDITDFGLLATLHANQLVMIGMLRQLLKGQATMAIDLTGMTAEVANNTAVDASILKFVANIVAQLNAVPASTDPVTQAALDALKTTLATNDAAIAAAVLAGTTVTPTVPSVVAAAAATK